MLRAIVIALGVACILGAAVIGSRAWFAGVELGTFGVLILVGTFFEQRYRSRRADGNDWQTTGERFLDPTSGKLLEVRYNSQTGERAYVEAGTQSAPEQ